MLVCVAPPRVNVVGRQITAESVCMRAEEEEVMNTYKEYKERSSQTAKRQLSTETYGTDADNTQ